MTPPAPPPTATDRLDRWLWHARFFKTRSLATRICRAGKVRVNGNRVSKANTPVAPGDVLTFPQGNRIRVARIVALATRRGPATEARQLYDDLTPLDDTTAPSAPERAGRRPTKRDRRALDRLRMTD
ncbi:MAG: RNA-binding S4 domain-containing protein [Alphaproteobacteria bacterium]|nr:MAG: RNA-binding S4 domain-containing protein [Alphaproteobacteria bacterium]